MWCLKAYEDIRNNENDKCLCIYILPNQKRSFGKSLSEIKLEGDATISRLHAVVSVESTEELETQYRCVISDISKYGTFVIRDKEKKKLPANDKFVLKAGDIVQFGLKQTTFIVLYHSFVIARSSLNEQDTKRLKDIMDYLGGKLSENWNDSCTHLTVPADILFTTKLACALASVKPITTMVYWEAVNIAIKESKELPKIENFLPKVKEEWLKVCSKSFLPNEKRKLLFKKLSFVHFCTKQYFAYAPLIIAAGGKSCVYPTKRPLTPRDLIAKNAIVIQQPANDSSQLIQITADYPTIYHKLQSVKRRMISDSEIPLAILYCSTEMYCNPKFDFATFFKLKTKAFCPSDVVIIDDTQDIDKRQIKRKIIPETYDSQDNENIFKKFCFSDKNKQQNIIEISKSNIATSMQDANNIEIKHIIIPETCDSQNNENRLKIIQFSNECEQRNISDINKDDIVKETQNNENVLKNIHLSNESEQKHILNNKQINVVNNIFYKGIDKQNHIISESSYSSKKCQDNFSDKSNIKQAQIIPGTGKYNERNITHNLTIEKVQQNVELQQEVFEENNFISTKNDQRNDMLGKHKLEYQEKKNIEGNDLILEKYNVNNKDNNFFLRKNNQLKRNIMQTDKSQQYKNIFTTKENSTTFDKSNLDYEENSTMQSNFNNNSQYRSTKRECSKNFENSERPQIVSIDKINNDICIKQRKVNKELLKKDCSRVEESQNSEKRKLNPLYNFEKNQEKKTERNNIQEKKKKKEDLPRKMETNWYERYVNQEFTDEVLRRDMPSGKKFTKVPVVIPKRILNMEDFTCDL